MIVTLLLHCNHGKTVGPCKWTRPSLKSSHQTKTNHLLPSAWSAPVALCHVLTSADTASLFVERVNLEWTGRFFLWFQSSASNFIIPKQKPLI